MRVASAVWVAWIALFSYGSSAAEMAPTAGRGRVNASFAGCESEAYKLLGVQLDDRAPSEYLEKKYEVIRTCMLRQGFSFDPTSLAEDAAAVLESLNSTKADEGEEELKRRLAIRRTSSRYWR